MRDLRLRCSRCGLAALIALLAGFAAGCHTSGTKVMVTLNVATATVALQGTAQFSASVLGAPDNTVTWQVNGVTGGNSTCGTISTNGLYTAPAILPASTACSGGTSTTTACTTTSTGTTTAARGCVLITAVSNQDTKATATAAVTLTSGVAITITPTGTATAGTSETLSFVATVTGTTTLTVNWLVNAVQGGSSTTGTITSTTIGNGNLANAATFTAPTAPPSPSTVTIEAQAVADTTQVQFVSVTIVRAADPTLTAVSPLRAPAGAYAQDFYLSGSNFLSTTSVLFAGVNVGTLPGGSVTAVSGSVLRVHVPFGLLGSTGTFTIAAQRQNGVVTPAFSVILVPVRPVLLGATPAILTQNSPTTVVELAGGYYAPSTVPEFNGRPASATQDSTFPRTLQATVNSNDLTEAGLFPIAVRTPGATPPRSAVNLTLRPAAAPVKSNMIAGFSRPVAIAVNDITGVPVVVDQGTSSLDLLDSGFTTIASSVFVGTTPTSVAVNGLRNLAFVTDQGSMQSTQTISSVSRSGGTVTATLASPLSVPGGNGVGMVSVAGVADPGFDGTFVVLIGSGTTSLTWAQAGPNASSSGGSASSGNDVAVVDLSGPSVTARLNCVGNSPLAVGVDEIHDRAIVVDQNSSAAFILDTRPPLSCPATQTISSISRSGGTVTATLGFPLTVPTGNGVGMVSVAGVSDTSFNGVFVVLTGSGTTTLTWTQAATDATSSGGSVMSVGSVLGTVAITTGTKPQIAVLPQLGWAIVTPGGAGLLSVVDLVRLSLVFSSTISSTTRGVAVNSETKTLILADPSSAFGSLYSLLDQSLATVSLNVGNVAAAANPLTNVGLLLNPGLREAFVLDLSTPAMLTTIPLGSDPIAVAMDPASDKALVVDDVDATVTVIDLGATRSRAAVPEPQILEVSPGVTFTSGAPVPILVIGAGFAPGAQIRLDETPIPTPPGTSRKLTASIPAGFLTQPRRLVVDVQNSPTLLSNVSNLLVAQAVAVGNSPQGVAIDTDRDLALVANSGDGTVSVVDLSPASLNFGTVISVVPVGSTPVGVGIVSRNGLAVVSNSGSGTASVLDLTSNPIIVPSTVSSGSDPTGIGVSESLGSALITNKASNSVSLFPLASGAGPLPSGLAVDAQPVAAAIAPDLNLAVVAHQGNQSTGNDALVLGVASGIPTFLARVPNITAPTGVDYDPVNQVFLIESSASNTITELSPITLLQKSLRVGVNPTSLAFNFQSGTLLTLNPASNTLSVVDLPNHEVRDILPLSGGTQYALAIHPRLNLFVLSDSANNRILILPMPR